MRTTKSGAQRNCTAGKGFWRDTMTNMQLMHSLLISMAIIPLTTGMASLDA